MIIKQVGFRPLYHFVSAFQLNEGLAEIVKDCPDADRASHAVFYGYIDPKEGLMLELLGVGKQSPEYFYFQEPYEGERVTIKAMEVEDVDFMFFPNLESRFRKKYDPRIEVLQQYDGDERLEETRELEYLDELRNTQFPDDVQVLLLREGLNPEAVWVRLLASGEQSLTGVLLNQPQQAFGINAGDKIEFFAKETKDKKYICYRSFAGRAENVQRSPEPQPVERKEMTLSLTVGKMDIFNYALYENNVPPVRGLRIVNGTGDTLEGLTLRITSTFDFFRKYEKALPGIPSGKPVALPDPHLEIDGKTLAGLTETINSEILVEICKGSEAVCSVRGQMKILAYDQWQGGETYRETLPAFVLPNHPMIPALMHDAAERLAKWDKPADLEGYQAHDPNRVRDLAAAAYAAIQKKNIIYAEPPASFSVAGQRIRTPESIMDQRLGTCLDMSLLYAALLEAMGLHPLLVVMKGHIFAGLWLKERSKEELKSGDVMIDNPELLTMRVGTGTDEMTFVECTAMCSGRQVSFEEAEFAARQLLQEPEEFQYAIDVCLSRQNGVTPIASRVKEGGEQKIEVTEKEEDELTYAPADLGLVITDVGPTKAHKITNKRELWESRLLDLTNRNMLLNLPHNSSIEPIMSSHIDELEDALADGHEFNLLPAPSWITELTYAVPDAEGNPGRPMAWLPNALKTCGIYEMTDWPVSADFDYNEKFRQEYRSHRLYTFCTEKQLDRELTTIYRAARSSQQENGVSSLYLAVGLLRWFPDPDSEKPCYAPLILFPIEIVRKSANQGYALHARDEESHFNTTLLEKLKQDYDLEIPGLDPLPKDEHGTDIKKVFSMVRSALYTIKNWDVVETCVIGNFSFAQFALWNDLHTAGDKLENSKIVRSLIKGHLDWEEETEPQEEEEIFLPITVDASQLEAITMAARGNTFVLHGPPGTGKSQTITGMIANLLAHGRKVLFVAEKMAALSVVQRRLAALGIDDFCLELHSDKASKKQVLTQLDKALAIRHPDRQTEYAEWKKKTAESRAELDGYAEHLHRIHNCGCSLSELISLYETVRDSEKMIHFDMEKAGRLTKEEIQAHLPLIGQLTAAGREVTGGIAGNKLLGVGLSSYSAEVRSRLTGAVEDYRKALTATEEAAGRTARFLGIVPPKSLAGYEELRGILDLYQEHKNTEILTLDILACGTAEAYGYFDVLEGFIREEALLLQVWQPIFLQMDMNAFLAKHEAAGKKFFGKSSAMAQVTAEIQAYCSSMLTYEQIPPMLNVVINHQNRRREVDAAYGRLFTVVQSLISQLPTREAYTQAYEAACEQRDHAERFPGGMKAIVSIAHNPDEARILEDFSRCVNELTLAEKGLNDLLNRTGSRGAENWFEEERGLCDHLMTNPASLKDWALYNQVRQECLKVGLEPVVSAYEKDMEGDELPLAYRKGIYLALINNIITKDDILSEFSGATFNESIAQFRQLDEALLEQARQEIFYRLASNVPTAFPEPEIGMELNLLRKAIGSNARGMSIRNLFDRLPHVLPLLTPCMLMSPNSVAQYLAQKNDLFDVVIFDEASQLPTCKAVGALSRAKDAVIVGDPKQMPPTTFFAGAGPEVDDLALDDLDSILDDALALGIPSQHLKWHYRSTHESLIAFSNSHFYDNKMFTFPSANDRERHVTVVHVDGLYNKTTNPKEAEAVVEEVVRRFHDPVLRPQSVGIVTFNVKQQTLIENLLAKQFLSNPELDLWANSGEDPLFVKNLENVQGDERDAILFSIGYGPDERGHVSNNFGPINKAGGGKRLNVAFSRARITMTIFSSIYSTDIRISDTSPDGLIAFRDFLKYAEGQDIRTESMAERQEKLARAGILQNICRAVTEAGYQTMTMIGHSDFHVDIAVPDPTDPSRYMLGILLDGDSYRQTKNTRDREVAQIGVLKNLGWTLCRVWTIDWWDNREREIRRILELLDQLKAKAEQEAEARKAEEEARRAEAAAREEESRKIKAEIEAQAAEVLAEEEEREAAAAPAASAVVALEEDREAAAGVTLAGK